MSSGEEISGGCAAAWRGGVVFRGVRDGFELIGLRSERVELMIAPRLGGKIVCLVDRKTGREWMWHPGDELKLFGNSAGDAFERSTLVGADECLPSVAGCAVEGREIPDHGEVWRGRCEGFEGEKGEIRVAVSLSCLPLDFSRCIRLSGNAVELRYELRNRSGERRHYLWAFHPLMRIEEGDQIEMDAEEIVVETTNGTEKRGEKWAWPRAREGVDFSRMDLGGKGYAKCFWERAGAGEVSIVNSRRQEKITFAYESRHISAVGLWLSRGGWNGYHHVAIEPTNAAADSLATAIEEKLCEAIGPGKSVEWGFRIILG